ncbi:MAG: hypothetical protein ACTSRP_13830 [Candidatus Helarchaeota archaeon]
MHKNSSVIFFIAFIIGLFLQIQVPAPITAQNNTLFVKSTTNSKSFTISEPILLINSSNDDLNPSIALDSNNNIHIAWYDQPGYNIYYTSSIINYLPQVVASSAVEYQYPRIFIDSNDIVHIIYAAITGVDQDIWYVNNSGGIFSNHINITAINGVRARYGNLDAYMDENDTIHVVASDSSFDGTHYEIYYFTIKNGNPSQKVNISIQDSQSEYLPRIKVGSSIFIVWEWSGKVGQGSEIMCRYKLPGFGWSEVINITKTISLLSYEEFPEVALTNQGDVYVFFIANLSGFTHLMYRTNIYGDLTSYDINEEWEASPKRLVNVLCDSNSYLHGIWYDTLDGDSEIKYFTNVNSTFIFFNLTVNAIDDITPSFLIDQNDNLHVVYSSNTSDYDIFYLNITYNPPFQQFIPTHTTLMPPYINKNTISLYWTAVENATSYYVYMSSSPINDVSQLIPVKKIDSTGGSPYVSCDLVINKSGTYYFVIIASNQYGNSTISNCEAILVSLETTAASNISNILIYILIGISIAAPIGAVLIYRSFINRNKKSKIQKEKS